MKQDIEASVIGGLLIGGLTPTASDVLATLEPEAFSIPLYRKAFEVIRKQARNRNLIDALMVAEACGEEHFTSILMTSKNCPSAANLKGYAGMVADNYHRRLVLEIMDEMREPIQSGTIDASSQAMDELVKRLSAIRKPRDEVKPVRLGEIITDYTDTLDRRLRNGEESDTLKTGIEELDAITGGMNAEDLVIIAARPGMGKTELALKIAEGVASRVIPGSDVRRGVLIFSMEMSALQIAERSIANAGRMSVSVLRNPASMDDEGWARVANGMSQLADLDVWVVDASRLRELIALGGPAYEALLKNIDLIRQFQSNEGMTLMDSRDKFETHQYSFSGLDDILSQFAEQISGAVGIPLVRLFGQSPKGFSTGDADLANYYDRVCSRFPTVLGASLLKAVMQWRKTLPRTGSLVRTRKYPLAKPQTRVTR